MVTQKAYIRWYKNFKRLFPRMKKTKEEVEQTKSLLLEALKVLNKTSRRLNQKVPKE